MRLKIKLCYLSYAIWVEYLFCDKNGLLPFQFGYVTKIANLTLSSFFPANIHW